MKMVIFLLICSCLHVQAAGQKISISKTKAPLPEIFQSIEKQSGYLFIYESGTIDNIKATVNASSESIEKVLQECLYRTGLDFEIVGSNILIKKVRPSLHQQEAVDVTRKITGQVMDDNNDPLEGASVYLKNDQKIGTTTDKSGQFSLTIPDGARVLVINFVGYASREINLTSQVHYVIKLDPLLTQMGDVVITGYNTIEKRRLTSAVTELKPTETNETTIDQMLQGRVSGLSVVLNSGEPGAVPVVKIRGTATLTGNAQPLWVLDGVILEDPVPLSPTELNTPDAVNRIGNAISGINPEDIETITILKDASATAIYGVKAAGGVIVLTTKRGQKSEPLVNFKTNLSMALAPTYDRFNMMNSKERIAIEDYYFHSGSQYYNAEANVNSVGLAGAYARYKSRELNTWKDFENEVRKAQTYNTDWFDVLFRNAISNNNYINVSGGKDKSTYYASLSYLDQQGADILTGYNRFTGLAKLNTQLSKKLSSEFYISGYSMNRSSYPVSLVPAGISSFTRQTPRPFDYAINTSRTFPVYKADGSPYFYRGHDDFYLFNIINEYDNSDQTTKTHGVNTRLSLNMKFSHRLEAFAVMDYSKTNSHQETYYKENTNQVAGIRRSEFGFPAPEDSYLPNGGIIFLNDNIQDYYMGRLALQYKPINTEEHAVELYTGGEFRANSYRGDNTTGWGYLHDRGEIISTSPTIGDALAGAPYLRIVDYARKYASYYGVASYTYLNKYTINGNIRYDGSNLFGSNPKYRWKPAWSVSGRWNASKEDFIKNIDFIDAFALRGSYGIQGSVNEQSTPQIIATFQAPAYWSGLNLLSIDQPANPNLRWEKTYNTNFGLDATLFHNVLNAAFNIYYRKSVDLITNTRISEVNGFSYLPINFADVTNRGIELGLQTRNINRKEFTWSTSVNFSYNKNEVVKVNLEPNVSRMLSPFPYKPDAALTGKPLNALYSVKYGYLDASGTPHFLLGGKDTTKVSTGLKFELDDLVYSGPLEAPLTGGINNFFSYKDFRLSVFFTYGLGNYLRMQPIMQNLMYSPDQNISKELLNAWMKPGDEAHTDIPNILNQIGSNTAKQFWNQSDIRVIKGDYLRLKNIMLQYHLPRQLLTRLKMEKAYIQIEGDNLALFTDKRLNGFDPETFVYHSLPNLTSFTLGLNVTF